MSTKQDGRPKDLILAALPSSHQLCGHVFFADAASFLPKFRVPAVGKLLKFLDVLLKFAKDEKRSVVHPIGSPLAAGIKLTYARDDDDFRLSIHVRLSFWVHLAVLVFVVNPFDQGLRDAIFESKAGGTISVNTSHIPSEISYCSLPFFGLVLPSILDLNGFVLVLGGSDTPSTMSTTTVPY